MASSEKESGSTLAKTLTELCRVCGVSYIDKSNKYNLLQGKDSSIKPEFTVALEELTGPVSPRDDLRSVCLKCKRLLLRYHNCCSEVKRIGSLIQVKARENANTRCCVASTLSQETKRHCSSSVTESPARPGLFSRTTVSVQHPAPVLCSVQTVKDAVSRSRIQSQAPVFLAAQPSIQSPAPILLAAQTSIQSPTPVYIAAQPSIQSQAPVYIAAQPSIQSQAPVYINAQPSIQSQAPVYIAAQPSAQSQAPVFLAAQPSVQLLAPVFAAAQPSAQCPAPFSGSIQRRETKITVRTAASVKTRILTGPLENIVLNIVQARYRGLSKSVMAVPGLSHLVVNEVLKRIQKECKQLTSLKFNSILRQTTPSALKDFKWMKVIAEWRTTAPTFLRFLEFASAASIETATAEGKQPGIGKKCAMAMAGATLLRARANHMCAPMYRNSLVLHHGRARKKCFEQFARLGICVSHASTLQKCKGMDHTWDSQFLQWKHNVCQAYPTTQHQADGSATLSTLHDGDSSDENQDQTDSGQGHLDTRHTTSGSSLSDLKTMQQSDDRQDQSSRARNTVWEIEVSLC